MSVSVTVIFKDLHRIRRLLRDLQSEIDLGPRVSKAQLKVRAAAAAAHADAHAAIGKSKLTIREHEGTVKQVATQLAKFEKQLESVGKGKEYEARQSEIRQAKEKIAAAEEAALAAMEELEARTAALPAADAEWAAAQTQYDDDQREGTERLDYLTAERTRAAAELATVEATLPKDLKEQYDRLVKRHGAECLAGVVGKVCQNCRTGMTEQQKIDLQSGRFMCCSTCGRGLYIAG
jgi:predicted  nucleic acid-binding Zn-ribbon protein